MRFAHLFVGHVLSIASAVVCHRSRPVCLAGGETVKCFEFPFMTIIQHKSMSCSGAIVSEQWILTAAHCLSVNYISNLRARDIKVVAGVVNYNVRLPGYTQVRQGTEVYVHPNYKVSVA